MEVLGTISTTATLGTEESGHCSEVETRVKVWMNGSILPKKSPFQNSFILKMSHKNSYFPPQTNHPKTWIVVTPFHCFDTWVFSISPWVKCNMAPAIKLKQIKWRTVFLLFHFWHVIHVTTVFVSVIFDLFVCFRLMVNLTQPAVLCFGNNIPDDKTGQHYYLDLVTQLQSYKEVQ